MKLSKLENIILIAYLGLVLLTGLCRFQIENYPRLITVVLFLTSFLPVFLGYASPIGNSLQNWKFSSIWITISSLIIVIDYYVLKDSEVYSKILLIKFSIIPAIGFFYFHLLRFGFKIIFKREPIVSSVGYGAIIDTIFKGHKANILDRVFTAISFFGLMFFTIYLMQADSWLWKLLQ